MLPTFWKIPDYFIDLITYAFQMYDFDLYLGNEIQLKGSGAIEITIQFRLKNELIGSGYDTDKSFFYDNIDKQPLKHPSNWSKYNASLRPTEIAVNIVEYAKAYHEKLYYTSLTKWQNVNFFDLLLKPLPIFTQTFKQRRSKVEPLVDEYQIPSNILNIPISAFYTPFLDISPSFDVRYKEIQKIRFSIVCMGENISLVIDTLPSLKFYTSGRLYTLPRMIFAHYPAIMHLFKITPLTFVEKRDGVEESKYTTKSGRLYLQIFKFIISNKYSIPISPLDNNQYAPPFMSE